MTITRTDGIQWRTLVRPSLLATTLAFAPACSRAPEAHAPRRGWRQRWPTRHYQDPAEHSRFPSPLPRGVLMKKLGELLPRTGSLITTHVQAREHMSVTQTVEALWQVPRSWFFIPLLAIRRHSSARIGKNTLRWLRLAASRA